MSALVISLDFELFWGVTDSKTIENYGANVEGEWQAIPAILALFTQYNVRATWATVGMLMCKDFKQWSEIRPSIMPAYTHESSSTYSMAKLAKNFPKLFFARPLVEEIQATEGQELGSHSYSHFYCSDTNTTVEQFVADLECTKIIFNDCGVKQATSFVFPRNQTQEECIKVLSQAGFTAYRGNQNHWVYRDGTSSYGFVGRLLRLADSYLPLTGSHVSLLPNNTPDNQLINIPATHFLRPVSGYSAIDKLQLHRIKKGLLEAARTNGIFHLWWHPHNFGVNTEANLISLEKILKYYRELNSEYGMVSLSMRDCRDKLETY